MPPVASPDTTCWRKMSTMFWWGATAAPPPGPPNDFPEARYLRSPWSVAEVGAADGVVAAQVGRRAGHDDAAGLEEIRVVREIEGDGRVLLDEEHAHAFLPVDGSHDAEDLSHDEGGEPERRLVEEEQARA